MAQRTRRNRLSKTLIASHAVETHAIAVYPTDTAPVVAINTHATVGLPQVTACAHEPTLTVFIFDESGSVTSLNDPTKPISNRHREAQLAVNHISGCRCGEELVAIRYFDPGFHDTGPIPVDRRGRRRLAEAIKNPPSSTGSQLGPSLDELENLLDTHADHNLAVVVLSDFQLFDADPAAVLERLAELDADVHAVVLHAPIPATLEAADQVTVTRVSWDSDPGAVARALVPALTTSR